MQREFELNIKSLHIELLKGCNLHCQTCDGPDQTDMLALDRIRLTLDSAKSKKIRQVYLTGGEPLIREDIYDIISYARICGLHTNMTTNGTLVDGSVVDKLYLAGLNNVSLSLDGTAECNDFIRGSGVYDRVIQTMELFQSRLSRMVSVLFTISRVNYRTIPDVIAVIRKFGVRKLNFNTFDPSYLSKGLEEKKEIFWIPEEEIKCLSVILSQSMRIAVNLGVTIPSAGYLKNIIRYFKGEPIIPQYGCQIPATSTIVEANGEVDGCWKLNTGLSVHHQGMDTIWDSHEYRKLVDSAQNSECPGCMFACYSEGKK